MFIHPWIQSPHMLSRPFKLWSFDKQHMRFLRFQIFFKSDQYWSCSHQLKLKHFEISKKLLPPRPCFLFPSPRKNANPPFLSPPRPLYPHPHQRRSRRLRNLPSGLLRRRHGVLFCCRVHLGSHARRHGPGVDFGLQCGLWGLSGGLCGCYFGAYAVICWCDAVCWGWRMVCHSVLVYVHVRPRRGRIGGVFRSRITDCVGGKIGYWLCVGPGYLGGEKGRREKGAGEMGEGDFASSITDNEQVQKGNRTWLSVGCGLAMVIRGETRKRKRQRGAWKGGDWYWLHDT